MEHEPETWSLSKYFREMRPNILWDALKLLGVGVVTAIIFAYSWLKVHLDVTIAILLALTFTISTLESIWRYRKWSKISQHFAEHMEKLHQDQMNDRVATDLVRIDLLKEIEERAAYHQQKESDQKKLAEVHTQHLETLTELADSHQKDLNALRAEIESLKTRPSAIKTALPLPDPREPRLQVQWNNLNDPEQAVVRFVLFSGGASELQILNEMTRRGHPAAIAALRTVEAKTTFLIRNSPDMYSVNPEFKEFLLRVSR